MTRLAKLLLDLLRKLLSSAFVKGSIRRLILLISFIQQRLSRKRTSHNDQTFSSVLPSQSSHAINFPIDDVVCPSLRPPSLGMASQNSLHVPQVVDERRSIISPTPIRGYLPSSSYAGPRGSPPQNMNNLSAEVQDDTSSIFTRRSVSKLPSSSSAALPIYHHGLFTNSASRLSGSSLRPTSRASHRRPNSRASQKPRKVFSVPSPPPSPNTALPAGVTAPPHHSTLHSPQQLPVLVPMSTLSIKRYDRNIVVPTEVNVCLVAPLKFKYSDGSLPQGWVSYTHPEGTRYYFHKEKRVYTEADCKELGIITQLADQILIDLVDMAQTANIALPGDVELVLELVHYPDETICGYYFVNHPCRCLFWLEMFDMDGACNEIEVVISESHLRYQIESQYWTHVELFPNDRELKEELVDEVRDIILHAAGDALTSPTSTAIWGVDKTMTILKLLDNVKVTSKKHAGAVCMVGRMMRNLTHNQFMDLHGQTGVRLSYHQSIHGPAIQPRTLLVKVLSPFVFWAPDIHLQALEKIWVDRVIHTMAWDDFIKKRIIEWQDFSLIATVLLSANMSFLAIQSVDNGGSQRPMRSAAQISSYISIVTSLGSVILALLLVRQHRSRGSAAEACKFLGCRTARGLETLAILYTLPYALLMWSTLAFLAAFSFMCFLSSDSVTRVLVGSVSFGVTALVIWCSATAWGKDSDRRLLFTWLANIWRPCRSMLSKGRTSDVELQEQANSVGSPTFYDDSLIPDERPKSKQQFSWKISIRKPTLLTDGSGSR